MPLIGGSMIRAIVTDIEGTTRDIRFVHQVLFPYARERLAAFVRAQAADAEVAEALTALRAEIAQSDADHEQLIAALYRFMDEDRKSTALKALTGDDLARGLTTTVIFVVFSTRK
uniref:Acireductone synthase n=1 Tax=Anopheles coluzzii TaxID=1518534 RepID=A0A8W7PWF3_ANOCL